MLKIGITGGIGSGKSTICEVFKKLGIPVYNADTQAKWLMNESPVIRQALTNAFGKDIYTPAGLDRPKLSALVFNQPEKLAILNGIVHPAVFDDYRQWAAGQTTPYSIKEAALMFESGSYRDVDFVVTVSAPKELRIQRVIDRDGITRKQVLLRMKNQFTEKQRLESADFVIKNDDKHLVLPQVLALHERFLFAAEG